jgi:hypothetical protein
MTPCSFSRPDVRRNLCCDLRRKLVGWRNKYPHIWL